MVASPTPVSGDLAHNLGTCPDWESNRRPFGSQASVQSTEPHQPGLLHRFFKLCNNPCIFPSTSSCLLFGIAVHSYLSLTMFLLFKPLFSSLNGLFNVPLLLQRGRLFSASVSLNEGLSLPFLCSFLSSACLQFSLSYSLL